MQGQVEIHGLREFRRDLRRIDPALVKGVREALRDAAMIVAYEARRLAPVKSGALRRSIKPYTRGAEAGVRATAVDTATGYRYPRRLEFGDLNRPFLTPALEAKSNDVERRLSFMLDDLADIWEG